MEVVLVENHRAPVVSMLVWVKAGSAAERPGEYGLAHLMEHMAFKGTRTRAPGEIAREVEAAGGRINAYTSLDQTVYYIDMASRFMDRGLAVLADMVLQPALDPAELEREKEVVLEEINRGLDTPTRRLSMAVFERAFSVHPYGRPIIGFSETVRAVTREQAMAFHQRWYGARNMILVLAGDFESGAVKTRIEEAFGPGPAGESPSAEAPAEPAQQEPRAAVLFGDVREAHLNLAYHIPGVRDADAKVLDLLAVILGRGRTGRLYLEVKRRLELAHEVFSTAFTPLDPGLFMVDLALSADKVLPALKATLAVIKTLAREPVSQEALDRARLRIQADFIRLRATMSGEARVAALFQAMHGDYQAKDRYLEDLDRVTLSDLTAAAGQYLAPENLTVGALAPQDQAGSGLTAEGLLETARPGRAAARNEVRKFTLANGSTLLIKPDASLPLVSLRAVFLGGVRFETEATNGLNQLLAEVWDRETEARTAEELSRAVEDMAGYLASFSGRNSLGLEAEFLSRHLDPGLDLLAEVLTRPALSGEEVEKARPNILAAIERQSDQLPARTFRLLSRTLYGPHPYALNSLGSPDSVRGLTLDQLRSYFRQRVVPQNMVLAAVGDVDPDRLKDRLESLLGAWQGVSSSAPSPAPPPALDKIQAVHDRIDRAQAHLALGFLTPGIGSPDRFALQVLETVLAGMGGRLFVELRDRQSLAYAVTAMFRPGLDTGGFSLYIAFAPDKYGAAKSGLVNILEGLSREPVAPDELERARESILGACEIRLQGYGETAANLAFNELYGLGYDYQKRYLEGIRSVTGADVLTAARRYLDPDRAVAATVGPVEGWG
jgi:zinc protease